MLDPAPSRESRAQDFEIQAFSSPTRRREDGHGSHSEGTISAHFDPQGAAVGNLVRGKNVASALDELRFTRKAAAPIVAKVLDSAIANAEQQG